MVVMIEYIWLGGNDELRSKTKVLHNSSHEFDILIDDLPKWNFDGSSTGQAIGTDSEVIIVPRALFNDPFRGSHHKMVLCDTETPSGNPLANSHRRWANSLFNEKLDEEPWYGVEQEYFLYSPETNMPLGFPKNGFPKEQGQYYCSSGANNAFGRHIVEEHLKLCLIAGINISGINAEVAPGQWEYQVGPCLGIDCGDHVWMSRYILNRVAEKYGIVVNIEPKPIKGDWNGSGCHTNFSTKNMREGTENYTGLQYIEDAIEKLSKKHMEHMVLYGSGNEERMSGKHETADYNVFTHGIANRGASVRIGNDVARDQRGYFEDRRPSSNMDPYLVSGMIFRTTCLD